MSNKKVALYIRVSTATQFEKGNSVPEQEKRLKAYCESRDWSDYEFFVDPGHSGSNMDRPALQKLIQNIKKFDMVLVYKLDRLSRNQRDILYLIEDVFKKNGVDFNSITENFDTSTPVGKLMLSIMGAFAELERQQINERLLMGRIASAAKGKWRGGSGVPTGYKYIPVSKGGTGDLTIDPEQAKMVHGMFNMMEDGYSCNAINEYYNFSGASVVKRLLQNPVYIGKIKYAGEIYDAFHEPIISKEQFDNVQSILKQREIERNYPAVTRDHLLTGFLWCSCGSRACYHHTSKKNAKGIVHDYDYYECYSRMYHKTMGKKRGCKNKIWRAADLEETIWDIIEELDFSEVSVREDNSEEIKAIRKEIQKTDRQIEKLIELYSVDGISIDALQARISALNSQKEGLGAKLSALTDKKPEMDEKRFKKTKSQLKRIKAADIQTQRAFISSLIQKITLLPDHDIKITWTF